MKRTKIVSLMLTVLLVLAMMPVAAFAASEPVKEFTLVAAAPGTGTTHAEAYPAALIGNGKGAELVSGQYQVYVIDAVKSAGDQIKLQFGGNAKGNITYKVKGSTADAKTMLMDGDGNGFMAIDDLVMAAPWSTVYIFTREGVSFEVLFLNDAAALVVPRGAMVEDNYVTLDFSACQVTHEVADDELKLSYGDDGWEYSSNLFDLPKDGKNDTLKFTVNVAEGYAVEVVKTVNATLAAATEDQKTVLTGTNGAYSVLFDQSVINRIYVTFTFVPDYTELDKAIVAAKELLAGATIAVNGDDVSQRNIWMTAAQKLQFEHAIAVAEGEKNTPTAATQTEVDSFTEALNDAIEEREVYGGKVVIFILSSVENAPVTVVATATGLLTGVEAVKTTGTPVTVGAVKELVRVPEGVANGSIVMYASSADDAAVVEDRVGNTLTSLATGMELRLLDGDGVPIDKLVVVVAGDIAGGDGVADITDMVQLAQAVRGNVTLTGAFAAAGDLAGGDAALDITDIVAMANLIRGN